MTPKQQRFVEEYLVDLNATQAAIRAGYAPRSAHVAAARLLKVDKVLAAVEAGKRSLSERTEVTQEWIIEQLRENHRLALNPGPDQSPNIAASNKALELLGRHLAMFTDNLEVKDKRLNREEREARIAELLERLGTPRIARASGAASFGNGSGKPH